MLNGEVPSFDLFDELLGPGIKGVRGIFSGALAAAFEPLPERPDDAATKEEWVLWAGEYLEVDRLSAVRHAFGPDDFEVAVGRVKWEGL